MDALRPTTSIALPYRALGVLNKDMEGNADDDGERLLPMSFADAVEGVAWVKLFEESMTCICHARLCAGFDWETVEEAAS